MLEPTLETISLILSIEAPPGAYYSLLKKAELEIELDPENLLRFCFKTTLLH